MILVLAPKSEDRMATLVYKMTHKGDPDCDLGLWGIEDCMGQVRWFDFDAVIGIGGRSWWTNQTCRTGEIVWIGLDPQKIAVRGKRGPIVRFAHFLYFQEGEMMFSKIAPKLNKSMYMCRFRLYGFSQTEEKEIETIRKLAIKAGPSSLLFTETTEPLTNDEECRRTISRKHCNR